MFTGIIEGLGTIETVHSSGNGSHITIGSDFLLDGTRIGDSIAVSGACLTAVKIEGNLFEVDVAPESLFVTTLGKAKSGDRVNLERALRLSDRLDGHLVSGHIDGTGKIKARKKTGNAVIVTIEAPENLTRYMIKKGSVAVDGISLTINELAEKSFKVSIIPHTAGLTTIGFKKTGEPVNLETDIVGKYVEKFLFNKDGSHDQKKGIDMRLLAESGFL